MKISKITGKTYEPSDAVYLTNPVQCQRYFKFLGDELFLDILYASEKREDALVFVWKRCPETKKAKELWDQHLL
jgi:hypothetical protein